MTYASTAIGSTILHRVEAGVSRITLNRPEAANAILPEQRDAILELLAAADADPEIRAVVLAATGKVFCSGADVSRLSGTPRRAGAGMERLMNGAPRLPGAILDCAKPVICAVQGTAAGLGAHIAYASDLVVASEAAAFVEAFVLRGMVMDSAGAYLLTRRIGLQKAKEMAFFGDKLSAREAADLGLVNKVVAAEHLEDTVTAMADRLAKGATLAISLTKRMLNRAQDMDRATALLEEAMAQEILSTSEDGREGVAAFVEKRPPQFKGY
jgi:2-(1,2-epoxy-1,2-dihydrophenyl)acetyl-CoA isomerase